jgi:hypothetical protein
VTRRRVLVAALALAAAACTQLLGLGDPTVAPSDGGDDMTTTDVALDVPTGDAPNRDAGDAAIDAFEAGCESGVLGDPANCGRCGHSCGGGACNGGKTCDPVALLTGVHGVTVLAIDGTSVYFELNGAIKSCPLAGCDGGAPFAIAAGAIVIDIAAAGGNIYWTNGGTAPGVEYCQTTGCPGGTGLALADSGAPGGIALDGVNVYWVESKSGGRVLSCALTGCPNAKLVTTGTFPYDVALDGPVVYFTNSTSPGDIASCAKTGCGTPTVVAPGPNGTLYVAVARGNVYFNDSLGNVLMCPVTGCGGGAPAVVASGISPNDLAADDASVYFVNGNAGIQLCPLAGCGDAGPTSLSDASGTHLVVDDNFVYWTEYGAGRVMRVAKP